MSNDLKKFLIPKLRNISRMWPEKNLCAQNAKQRVQIGFYKNGKPEFKVLFKCNICLDLFDRSEIQIDHLDPVIELDGFIDWNDFITRLFCNVSNLQALCRSCHYLKSNYEMEKRKEQRKLKKLVDKSTK